VEALQQHRVDDEEVASKRRLCLCSQELCPCRAGSPGAGSMSCLRSIAHTLEGASLTPILASSPWTRR
jgi:hypothetical protein